MTGYASAVIVPDMATSPLRTWLDTQPRGTAAALSRRLGKQYRTLARWTSGERTPCIHDAAAIADATGQAVRVEDWPDNRPKERRCKSPKKRRAAVAS